MKSLQIFSKEYYSANIWWMHHIKIIIGFLINVQVQGQHPHQWPPLPDSWLAARMADLTPDLHRFLS